jgi:hypothetical protein
LSVWAFLTPSLLSFKTDFLVFCPFISKFHFILISFFGAW